MVFIVGTVHPPPGKGFTEAMPQGYGLSSEELAALAPKMTGIPLTVEHTGIFEAVALMQQDEVEPTPSVVERYLNRLGTVQTRPVGMVVDAFQAPTGWLYVLGVIPAEHDAVRWMIEKGALRGLSLTHIDGTSVPLEVSLCHEPARPGCHVKLLAQGLNKALQYKRAVEQGATEPDVFETIMAASEPTMLEKVLESLKDEDKTLIAARMEEMVKLLDAEKARADTAEQSIAQKEEELVAASAKLKAAEDQSAANVGLLKQQVDILMQNLDAATIDNYALQADRCAPLLESDDPNAIRRTVDRLLCAANHTLMQRKASLVTASSRKRKAEPEEVEDVEMAAPTPQSALSRAMASTFTL